MSSTRLTSLPKGSDEKAEVFREAVTMVLYVSVVEIAELAAIPESHFAHGRVTGPVEGQLLTIVWGTARRPRCRSLVRVRARRARLPRGTVYPLHPLRPLAQIGGAMFVAALSSLPALVLSDVRAQETAGDVPALLIGVIAYLVARSSGRPRVASLFYGVTALALGVMLGGRAAAVAIHSAR